MFSNSNCITHDESNAQCKYSKEKIELQNAITQSHGTPCMLELARLVIGHPIKFEQVREFIYQARRENGNIAGGMCVLGNIIYKNSNSADGKSFGVELLRKCALNGCWLGMYFYGAAHEHGWAHIEQNLPAAIYLYQVACTMGGGEQVQFQLACLMEKTGNIDAALEIYDKLMDEKQSIEAHQKHGPIWRKQRSSRTIKSFLEDQSRREVQRRSSVSSDVSSPLRPKRIEKIYKGMKRVVNHIKALMRGCLQ